jgi:hypothetical protein
METTKYRLLKEPISEQIKRLGQSYKSVSRYMTENQDENWLNNRTSTARTQLVEYKQAQKLDWLLGVEVDAIEDEVDDASYKKGKAKAKKETTITITQDQWNNLLHLMTSAVRDGVKAALNNE